MVKFMQFDKFMTNHNYSNSYVAGLLAVSRETVRLWRLGEQVPRKQTIKIIAAWTKGQVKLADWYRD